MKKIQTEIQTEIQTILNKLSKRQLQKICKRMGIKCPKRKRVIVNKLLQPLGAKYKMFACMSDDTCEGEGEDKYSKKYKRSLETKRELLKDKSSDRSRLELLQIRKEICNINTVNSITEKYLTTLTELLKFKNSDRKHKGRLESKEFIISEEEWIKKFKQEYPPNVDLPNDFIEILLLRFQNIYVENSLDLEKFDKIVQKMNKNIENCNKNNLEINMLISHLQSNIP